MGRALRARWWLPLLGALAGLAVALLVVARATPVYSSTTQLFVGWNGVNQVGGAGPSDVASIYAANLFAQQRLSSYVDVIESEDMARDVVSALDLAEDPADLARRINATAVSETVVLRVTVSDEDPAQARAVADEIGRQFSQRASSLETVPGSVTPAVVVSVIDSADVPTDAISPDTGRDIGFGLAGGALLGLVLALLPVRFRRSVETAGDVRDATGKQVLATFVASGRGQGTSPTNDAALRAVRAQLRTGHAQALRLVLVTGTEPGVGASTLATELAVSLADSGVRTILVDADLRSPRSVTAFGLADGLGLSDVLSGTAAVTEAERPVGNGTLTVLAGGTARLDPSNDATAARLRELLRDLRGSTAFVVVDAPPLNPVPDAAGLGPAVDGVLLVARFGRTHRTGLADAAAALTDAGSPLLGVVLTQAPVRAARQLGLRFEYPVDRHRQRDPAPSHPGGPRASTVVPARRAAMEQELT